MSFNNAYPNAEAQMRSNTQKRYGNNLPKVQKRWLKKVYTKCSEFLEKMKRD